MSELCVAFDCTPSVAEAEYARDPVLIHGIFDYRNAKATVDLIKQGESGAKVLKEHPEMMQIVGLMRAAQG